MLLTPVIAVVTFHIRRRLGSPVLYRQIRSGKEGEQFGMIKFRTMRNDMDTKGKFLSDSGRMGAIWNCFRVHKQR